MTMMEETMTKPDLNVPVHSGDDFTWEGREGCAFTSDLIAGNQRLMGRLFRDSIDEGFFVRSHRTGKSKLFFLVDLDLVNDTRVFTFETVDGIKVRVYND